MKDILLEIVAPEANHLLHEKPSKENGFTDFGWRCREHAIILSEVLKFKKIKASIIYGDVSIYHKPSHKGLTTIKSIDDKHYWCSTRKFPLIDISPSLRFHTNEVVDLPPVINTGSIGEFRVEYVKSASQHARELNESFITYSIINRDEPMQIEKTCALLAKAVSMHVIDVITGSANSMITKSREDAIDLIFERYSKRLKATKNESNQSS